MRVDTGSCAIDNREAETRIKLFQENLISAIRSAILYDIIRDRIRRAHHEPERRQPIGDRIVRLFDRVLQMKKKFDDGFSQEDVVGVLRVDGRQRVVPGRPIDKFEIFSAIERNVRDKFNGDFVLKRTWRSRTGLRSDRSERILGDTSFRREVSLRNAGALRRIGSGRSRCTLTTFQTFLRSILSILSPRIRGETFCRFERFQRFD